MFALGAGGQRPRQQVFNSNNATQVALALGASKFRVKPSDDLCRIEIPYKAAGFTHISPVDDQLTFTKAESWFPACPEYQESIVVTAADGGSPVALRLVKGLETLTVSTDVVNAITTLDSVHIVSLHKVTDFPLDAPNGSPAMVTAFVSDHVPYAATLKSFIKNEGRVPPLSFWGVALCLLRADMTVQEHADKCGVEIYSLYDSSKVLLTPNGRIFSSGVGYVSMCGGDVRECPPALVQILVTLIMAATGTTDLPESCDKDSVSAFLARHRVSPQITAFLLRLTEVCDDPKVSTADVVKWSEITDYSLTLAEASLSYSDTLQDIVVRSSENGAILRLLLRLEMACSRESAPPVLTSFLDAVFPEKPTEGANRVSVAMGRAYGILGALNARSESRVVLQDGGTRMVVSFAEIAEHLEQFEAQN